MAIKDFIKRRALAQYSVVLPPGFPSGAAEKNMKHVER